MKILFLGGPADCQLWEVPDEWQTTQFVKPMREGCVLDGNADPKSVMMNEWTTGYSRVKIEVPTATGTNWHAVIVSVMMADNYTLDRQGCRKLCSYLSDMLMFGCNLMTAQEQVWDEEDDPPETAPVPPKTVPTSKRR